MATEWRQSQKLPEGIIDLTEGPSSDDHIF